MYQGSGHAPDLNWGGLSVHLMCTEGLGMYLVCTWGSALGAYWKAGCTPGLYCGGLVCTWCIGGLGVYLVCRRAFFILERQLQAGRVLNRVTK